ncbi:hypothetical protein BO94DRAFT_5225 [Aspergillus sclerotioniger CBS 115572]|uniref:Uncharacterized protein n=1 Tax=Aspergillus sclerotioniger CBS 115572 TaxID=1450535 RepID=A0A317XCP6_9EURO|nr:hypothetical protein BO94DRAFT_5225 [Aspergillus sclerotioniger CBS 115572]PWY96289.1 hypothetical protein BO94DRAFT_5225 [Aspergillus sclerotioniger CBS 115572]
MTSLSHDCPNDAHVRYWWAMSLILNELCNGALPSKDQDKIIPWLLDNTSHVQTIKCILIKVDRCPTRDLSIPVSGGSNASKEDLCWISMSSIEADVTGKAVPMNKRTWSLRRVIP